MAIEHSMHKRLIIVFILGFSSGLPLSLLTSTLQAWFSDSGISIMVIGMLSLIGLPYIYRILWGPLLDRYSLTRLGKRRSWILATQFILLTGFNLIAWFSPESTPNIMAVIAFFLACMSATQDMAIEAHRTEYLPLSEHGLGASIATFGYRLGLLVSGSFALILAQYAGWTLTYKVMGFLLAIGMLAVWFSEEPSLQTKPVSLVDSYLLPLKELLTRAGFIPLVFFILFYKAGEAFTTTTSGIVMPFLIQGIGFSLATIGYINKLVGVIALLIGGLIAGFILIRWSVVRALMWFGLMQAATNTLFVLLAISGKNIVIFALAVILDNFAAGMATTALVAFFMGIVDRRFTATQFSILAAISTIPRVFSGPVAALLQSWVGWVGLYQISVVLALLYIPFLMSINRNFGQHSKTRCFSEVQ